MMSSRIKLRLLLWGGLLAVITACTPPQVTPLQPASLTTSPTATATSVPSATPLPSPAAIDLGVLGKGSAQDMAWSPDGSLLAVVSTTGVYIYETQTWQIVETISNERLENGSISTLAFSPEDGNLVLTVSSYPTSFLRYDLQNGELTPWLENIDMTPRTPLAFSPDGKIFALINYEHPKDGGYLIVLELRASASGKRLHQLFQDDYDQEKVIEAFAFSPDGQQIAAAGRDNLVRVWDTASGNLLYELQHDSDVADISYSPDGKVLASTGKDATVRFWDVQTGENLYILRGFERALQHVSYLDDGKRLLVGQLYENIFQQYILGEKQLPVGSAEITIETGEEFYESYESITTSAVVRISPDTRQMAVLLNAQVQIWDLETGQPVLTLPEYNDTIRALAFSPSGDILALADHDVYLWDISTQELVTTLQLNARKIADIAFRPGGEQLAVAIQGENLVIWDLLAQQKLPEIDTDCPPVLLAYTPDGDKLAAACGQAIHVLDADTGQIQQEFIPEHVGGFSMPRQLAFSADGSQLFYITENARWGWDIPSGQQLYMVETSKGDYYGLTALSPHLGIVGKSNASLQFFDPQTGEYLYEFAGSEENNSVVLSPDGSLVGWENQNTIDLLDATSGGFLLAVDFYYPYVFSISPENHFLAASFGDTIYLWDISAATQHDDDLNLVTATPAPTISPTSTVTPEPITLLSIQPQSTPVLEPDAISAENVTQLEKLGELGLGRARVAAWASDGKTLAVGGSSSVYIFDHAPQPSQVLSADGTLLLLAFSPDGRLLAGQIGNSAVQVWDVSTGSSLYSLENMGCWNQQMKFSSDGQILSANCGSITYYWSMADGHLLNKSQEVAASLHISPDGNLRVQVGMSSAHLLAAHSDEIIQTFDLPGMAPALARFSPDGKTLLVWFYRFEVARSGVYYPGENPESVIQLWHIAAGESPTLRTTLTPGEWYQDVIMWEAFQGLAFTPDSQRFYTASGDGQVQIWDLRSGALLSTLPDGNRIYLSPDGKRLITLGSAIQVWDVSGESSPTMLWEIPGFVGSTSLLTFVRDGTELATVSNDAFRSWAQIGKDFAAQPTVIAAPGKVWAVSPDGNWLAYSTHDELLIGANNLPDPNWQTLEKLANLQNLSTPRVLRFSPDSSLLAVSDPERKVQLWAIGQPNPMPMELVSDTYVSGLIFSPDGKLLLGSDMRSQDMATLYLWDTGTGELLRSWQMIGYQLAFHPDGITLAATSYLDRKLLLYDLRSGELLRELAGSRYARDIAFSLDGSLLVAVTDEGIEFWDIASGERVHEIEGGPFDMLDFSPDGKLLVVSFYDGKIQYWGLPSE